MKTIQKFTDDGYQQIFEIIESKKELHSWIRDHFWDSLYSEYKTNIYDDEDSSCCFWNKNGDCTCFFHGDKVKKFNISKITKLISTNSSTTVIYGNVSIIKNEKYGDYETFEN